MTKKQNGTPPQATPEATPELTQVSRETPTSQKQTSRAQETSEMMSPGIDRWSPVAQLETPMQRDGYRYRWIREEVNGQRDSRNMTMSRREGYEFVRISEAEGLDLIVDEDEKGDGLARHGGLVLAKIPEEFCRQRDAYYAKRRAESVAAANRLQGVSGGDISLPTSYEDRGSGVVRDVGAGAQQAMQQEGDW